MTLIASDINNGDTIHTQYQCTTPKRLSAINIAVRMYFALCNAIDSFISLFLFKAFPPLFHANYSLI